jgi:Zn-dependent peptidase ImmA (M78 family)
MAEEGGIGVFAYDLPKTRSMSAALPDGYMAIGIDYEALTSTAEERVHLAHEIGHCKTGSFYNKYSCFDVREKHERKANIYAVQYLMPLNEVKEAYRRGCREIWDMAEYFGVTEDFAKYAMMVYKIIQ